QLFPKFLRFDPLLYIEQMRCGQDGEEEGMRALDTLTPETWRGYQRDTFPDGSWMNEDGMLRTVAEAEPIDLITRQQYRHFELTLEWRVARGGNSGGLY